MDKALSDAILITYLLLTSALAYWIGLCLHRPKYIRLLGAWLGSRLIALGYAVEDAKDTFRAKKTQLFLKMREM